MCVEHNITITGLAAKALNMIVLWWSVVCCGSYLWQLFARQYLIHISVCNFMHTHTHTTILRPLFRDYQGEPMPEVIFWTLWCRGRHTDNPAGRHSIRTNQRPTSLPPFLRQIPFLQQPLQFILAWDVHQICLIVTLCSHGNFFYQVSMSLTLVTSFVSDIAIFVLKRDVKLQLTNQ